MAPIGPKSILYKYSHVAYQIEGNEELNTAVQNFALGACLGSKSRNFGPFFFYCHTIPLRLFELEP